MIDNQKIKEMLISLREPDGNFEVVFMERAKWRGSKYVNGIYNPDEKTITLYLSRLKKEKDIIRVGIHEYAHHFQQPKEPAHGKAFWNRYFELLETAEKKGFYSCDISKSDRLVKMTKMAKQYNLMANIKKLKRFSYNLRYFFCIIYELCFQIDVNFQHYTVKHLGMDWYKDRYPLSSYQKLAKKLRGYRENLPDEKKMDALLTSIFAHYCKREYKIAHPDE